MTSEFTTTDSGTVAVQVGKSREEPVVKLQVVRGKEEKKKGYTGKGGTSWFDGISPQGVWQDGGGAWQAVSSNPWTSTLFLLDDKPPGLKLENSLDALDERDSDEEIPVVSYEDFSLKKARRRLCPKVEYSRKRHKTEGSAEKERRTSPWSLGQMRLFRQTGKRST